MMQQRGGTLVGFVVGVLVGLGSALAVAVYVTKVPVPFLNKGESRTVDQDAAESKKNKDWDPNAPLYGKNPAKPTLPAASEPLASASGAAAPTPPTTPAPTPGVPAGPPAKVEAKPAASADPLGDLAKARTATAAPAAAATATAGAEPFNYFVQVGAFRTPEDAESQPASCSVASRPGCRSASSPAAPSTAYGSVRLTNARRPNGPRKNSMPAVSRRHWCGSSAKRPAELPPGLRVN